MSGGVAPQLLTSALDQCKRRSSSPRRFNPKKIEPGTDCIRGEDSSKLF
jgi:hypothetical protein